MCVHRFRVPHPFARAFCVVLVFQRVAWNPLFLCSVCGAPVLHLFLVLVFLFLVLLVFFLLLLLLLLVLFSSRVALCLVGCDAAVTLRLCWEIATNNTLVCYSSDSDHYSELEHWVFLCIVVTVKKYRLKSTKGHEAHACVFHGKHVRARASV